MKHKYFKKDEVLEAKIGYKSSYLWRILCSTIDLVKTCIYWRVGNGQRVKLWQDKWNPFYILPPSHIPNQLASLDTKVEALIDEDTKNWNRELLFQLFHTEEAGEICSIPLSKYGAID